MRAPFPYFGGKSRVSSVVWEALGDVSNYVEPFAGSLAVLLSRPGGAGLTETVNDMDGLLVNAWRAMKADPAGLAEVCGWPVSELDLHARHTRLIAQRENITERLRTDPDYYHLQLAGWWIWGACCWIGSGWGLRQRQQVPYLSYRGQGIHRSDIDSVGAWFDALGGRLARVRIACGDWRRVLTPSVLETQGQAGVFLDPPYDAPGANCENPYALKGRDSISAEVAAWAFEMGTRPEVRIVLCGYDGEHIAPEGWRVISWKAHGGYGSQAQNAARENAGRERLWLSPHCLPTSKEAGAQLSLLAGAR